MKRKSLKINAILNGFKSLLSLIFPLITFPYVSRVLSVNGIGKYNFSKSIIGYFLLIAALGISTYGVREGTKYRDNIEKIDQFASEIFTINVFSAILAYILLFLCLLLFSKLHSYFICILIFSIQIGFSVIGIDWLFTIYEDFAYITIRSIIFQILSILLLFIFVRHSGDYLNYALITVFSAVGSNLLNFLKAKKDHKIRIIFSFNWKKHIKPILILFAASIANIIYVNSDITILGLMKSNYVVGIYSISSSIYNIIKNIFSAVLLVTIPRLALLYGKKDLTEFRNLLRRLTNILALIILPATTGLILLSKQIILIFAGNHFVRSISSLRILSVAYIFSILAWILSDCVLIPAKREKFVMNSMIISAVVNILFNILFIPFLSENAAALSTVFAELIMLIVNYIYSKDLIRDTLFSSSLLNTFKTSILGCIGIIIICFIINALTTSLWISLVLSILLSVIWYAFSQVVLKNTYILEFYNWWRIKK
ncbi:flippase [Lactobacillus sp. UMNPBX18]|nr:flippase [Lactobacillus sp. UMNPBX18]